MTFTFRPVARGGVRGWNAPTTSLDARTRNLQNMKHKYADQPAKRTPDIIPHPVFVFLIL